MRESKLTNFTNSPVTKQAVKPKDQPNLRNFTFKSTARTPRPLSKNCLESHGDDDDFAVSPRSSIRRHASATPRLGQQPIHTPHALMRNLSVNKKGSVPNSPITVTIPSSPILLQPESPTNIGLHITRSPSPITLAAETQCFDHLSAKSHDSSVSPKATKTKQSNKSSPTLQTPTPQRKKCSDKCTQAKSFVLENDIEGYIPETPKRQKDEEGLASKPKTTVKKLKAPEFLGKAVSRSVLASRDQSGISNDRLLGGKDRLNSKLVTNDSISEFDITPPQSPQVHKRPQEETLAKVTNSGNIVDLISSESEQSDVEFGMPGSLTQWYNSTTENSNMPDSPIYDLNHDVFDEPESHDANAEEDRESEKSGSLSPVLGFVDLRKEINNDPSLQMYMNQFGNMPKQKSRRGRKTSGGTTRTSSNEGSNLPTTSYRGNGGSGRRWRGSRSKKGSSGRRSYSSRPRRGSTRRQAASTARRPVATAAQQSSVTDKYTSYNHYAAEPVLDITDNVGWESKGYARFS